MQMLSGLSAPSDYGPFRVIEREHRSSGERSQPTDEVLIIHVTHTRRATAYEDP